VSPIIRISDLTKTYASGLQALKNINLDIHRGEIFALLGPNGAGKTTLVSTVCGIVGASSGRVLADGHDIVTDFRAARSKIGLVPQELTTDAFETVWATVNFSRGLFGRSRNYALVEELLRKLSLWDKKDSKIIQHPLWMLFFLVLTAVTFSLFGFIIGIWADSFEKLQVIPLMVITPLTFLGGSFYSIDMLPPIWQKITLFNPVVYLISGFRWSFFGVSDVSVGVSVAMALVVLALCLGTVWWMFRTGYRLKN